MKKLIHIAITAILLLVAVFTASQTTLAACLDVSEVSYIDENGDAKTVSDYTVLDGSETELNAGWYVVNSDISYDDWLILNEDVHLILADGATMKFDLSYWTAAIIARSSFSIYGQSGQTGKLEINSPAGIDSGNENSSITINGGTVDIVSDVSALSTNTVTINRGIVNINGYFGCNKCNINGGKLNVGFLRAFEVSLGCSGDDDVITAASFWQNSDGRVYYDNVVIASGQVLTDGENFYGGSYFDDDVKIFVGKTLRRAFSVTLPKCMRVVGGTSNGDGSTTLSLALNTGYTLKSEVKNGETTISPDANGYYSVIITDKSEQIVITADFANEIEIRTVEDLKAISNLVNAGKSLSGVVVKLIEDIDFNPSDNETDNFTAIGRDRRMEGANGPSFESGEMTSAVFPFRGTFDGGGHSIKGIRINQPEKMSQGLFGYICDGAVVKDVVLVDAKITGSEIVGAIAGKVEKGEVSRCKIIDAVVSGTLNVCGVVGYSEPGSILDNLVFCANIVSTNSDFAFAIAHCDASFAGNICKNNYFYNCKINDEVTQKGLESDAASPIYKLTLGEGVTIANPEMLVYTDNDGNNYCASPTQVNFSVRVVVNDADGDDVEVSEWNGKYSFLMPAKDVCVEKYVEVIFNEGALKVVKDGNGYTTAILDGAYTGTEGFSITENISVNEVMFSRAFTDGVTSTVILPFGIDEGKYSGGDFYKIGSVDADNGEWTAEANKVTSVTAHTPYIFVPNGSTFKIEGPVTLESSVGESLSYTEGNWTFTGVYLRKRWGEDDGDNKDYCFAANQTDEIHPGNFVKIGTYVQLKPFRCYLTNSSLSKSGAALPQSIKVRLIDETATVIDVPIEPVDNFDDDIKTPVSEVVPAANIKVWSYDKNIYISAAVGTDYRIIDAAGRLLAAGTTNTNRDEIRLGSHSGIVIVIINGKTFKLNY